MGERNNGPREMVNKAWGHFLIIENNNKPKVNFQIQNELHICQCNVRLYNKYPGSKVYLCSLKRDRGDFFSVLFYFLLELHLGNICLQFLGMFILARLFIGWKTCARAV